MDVLTTALDFVLHLDEHLAAFTADHGTLTYALLFGIVFAETGLVVTPFLPGDSLLFAAGAVASLGSLDPVWLFVLLAVAAILGDSVNYWIGARVGPGLFDSRRLPFLKEEYLERTNRFYERHGAKTIVLARFVPIVRTFAPFVAGVGSMRYPRFLSYNVFGGFLWVGLFVFGGYFFSTVPWIQARFNVVVFAIIVLSLLPAVVGLIRQRRQPVA